MNHTYVKATVHVDNQQPKNGKGQGQRIGVYIGSASAEFCLRANQSPTWSGDVQVAT